ncbi:unnamed protein product, partial [marine sediment metagenome]
KIYERVKKLYKQQTGKRPIYANKETKGFKQWLEHKKKSEEKEKPKLKKELKVEQKKEETWKWFLKNWIGRATEIDPELKSELRKLVEEYDELEKLIKKYSQLYNKAHDLRYFLFCGDFFLFFILLAFFLFFILLIC